MKTAREAVHVGHVKHLLHWLPEEGEELLRQVQKKISQPISRRCWSVGRM
jgi:hypothetical protein